MRIGVDARPLATRSGIGRYTRELLERLVGRGDHDYFLYSNAPIDIDGPRVRRRVAKIGSRLSGSLVAQTCYPFWAAADKLDVFWSPRHHLPLALRGPMVVTIHDLVWRKAPRTMMPLGRIVEGLLMPVAVRRADRIIAVSESTRRDLVEFMPRAAPRVDVVPGAPFVVPGAPRPGPGEVVILFVGTFEPRKNLARLLAAYRLLLDRGADVPPLVLAGNLGWRIDVPALLAERDLTAHVKLVLAPDDEELVELYRQALFLVMPSLYEGFGLPVLEAMSFGKPVIVSTRASLPEVSGPGGVLVDPMDTAAIADAMDRLLRQPALRAELGRRGADHAAGFTWDAAAARTLEILEAAAGH